MINLLQWKLIRRITLFVLCVCKNQRSAFAIYFNQNGQEKKTWGKNHRNNGKQSEIHTEKSIENKSIY